MQGRYAEIPYWRCCNTAPTACLFKHHRHTWRSASINFGSSGPNRYAGTGYSRRGRLVSLAKSTASLEQGRSSRGRSFRITLLYAWKWRHHRLVRLNQLQHHEVADSAPANLPVARIARPRMSAAVRQHA